MKNSAGKNKDQKGKELRKEAEIGDKTPGRNISEQSDIEQARIENRRQADLEDKTPGGDGGPEDTGNERQASDPLGETNY